MKLIKSKHVILLITIIASFTFFVPIFFQKVNAQTYTNISVQTAFDMIGNKTQYPNLIILDVREQWEYNENHLCNSTLIPLSEISSRISELEPYKDTEIIVYCRSGSRSAQASQNLADNHNFTKIYNMLGGINAWITVGYDVCEGKPQPTIIFYSKPFLLIIIGTMVIISFYFKKKIKTK